MNAGCLNSLNSGLEVTLREVLTHFFKFNWVFIHRRGERCRAGINTVLFRPIVQTVTPSDA